jgi:hypothetical protein
MTTQKWKFNRDIKDAEWNKFCKDVDTFVGIKSVEHGSKMLTVEPQRSDEVRIIINRDEDAGSWVPQTTHHLQEYCGIMSIAMKSFGDGISVEENAGMPNWKTGIENAAKSLDWDLGETINLVTGKLGIRL